MALFSLGLQASFVLSIHLNFEMVITALNNGKEDIRVEKNLKAGKWVFVGILAGEQPESIPFKAYMNFKVSYAMQ